MNRSGSRMTTFYRTTQDCDILPEKKKNFLIAALVICPISGPRSLGDVLCRGCYYACQQHGCLLKSLMIVDALMHYQVLKLIHIAVNYRAYAIHIRMIRTC